MMQIRVWAMMQVRVCAMMQLRGSQGNDTVRGELRL
jgi:hypothetical protein